jgi:hypothetical protein
VTRALAIALAAIALIGAGCSDGAAGNGGTSSATASGSQNATKPDKALRFAACMRDNGVKDFPDPDASGRLTIDGVLNGSSLDPDAPAFKSAIAACRDLQPPGFTGRTRSDGQQDAALAFAQCIRDNGVKDFPDPTKDSPLVDTNRIPSANRPGGMTALRAAMQKCRAAAAKAMEGR